MDPVIIFISLALGILVGAVVGWLWSNRQAAAALAESATYQKEIATLAEALKNQEEKYQQRAQEHSQTLQELATLRGASSEREKALESQIEQLGDMQKALTNEFKAISQTILDDSQKKFFERANERFEHSEKSAAANLRALLQPVHEQLTKYETSIRTIEKERSSAFDHLKGELAALRNDSERVSTAASNLAGILRDSPKARGNWGERQLRNVLEMCGLSEYVDFETEVHVTDSEGNALRPDVVIRVPGGQNLIIDAKMSLKDYQDAYEQEEGEERTRYLEAHARAMRSHVRTLNSKAYWEQFADAPDFVIMFVPGEHFLAAALDYDRALWDYAFENRVLLATPTNLVAIARTVSAVWRQEKLANEAREIAEVGRELYKRMATMGEHIERIGKNLSQTNEAYNRFIGSFDSRVMTQVRRFETLGVDTSGKNLPDLPRVEQTPRPLLTQHDNSGDSEPS